MRTLLVVLVLTAGCGSKRAPSRPLPPERTPYLLLFERGRSWTLPARGGDDVTCTVAEVKQVGDADVSRLDCGSLLVSGTWVSTPAGLYHPHLPVDDPDELALLGENDLLIGALAKERQHSRSTEGATEWIEAFPHESSWCVTQITEARGDRRMYMLCFDGKNITGAAEETVSEGTKQRVELGNAPTEIEDDSHNESE